MKPNKIGRRHRKRHQERKWAGQGNRQVKEIGRAWKYAG